MACSCQDACLVSQKQVLLLVILCCVYFLLLFQLPRAARSPLTPGQSRSTRGEQVPWNWSHHEVYSTLGGESSSHVGIPTNGSALKLTVPVSGRLGNWMFQYASLLGIATMNGRTPFYGTSSGLNDIFQTSYVRDLPQPNSTVIFETHYASYDPKFQQLPRNNVVLLQYFQSYKYFHFIEDTIRKEFTFKPHVLSSASNVLKSLSGKIGNRTTIGIHIRRGDKTLPDMARKGVHVASASYLSNAMELMRQRHGDVIFLVVSIDVMDLPQNCTRADCVKVVYAQPEVHLALLTLCDHVIMTVGTFGWWGGYLNRKRGDVVYFWDDAIMLHKPPLPDEIIKPEDHYLPHWIPVGS